jgi:formate hydrogenlyase subunit 6/NADH:ubiquinone oxidoreductase subunit I
MSLLTFRERLHLPIWDDSSESIYERVDIDLDTCDGCKQCVIVCPANVLELVIIDGNKKAQVKEDNRGCVSCNNCLAICSTQSIHARKAFDFVGYYKQLGEGEFSMPRRF